LSAQPTDRSQTDRQTGRRYSSGDRSESCAQTADCRQSFAAGPRVFVFRTSSIVRVVNCFRGGTCAFRFRGPFAIAITRHRVLASCMWDCVRLCSFRVNFPRRRERAPPVQQPWRTRVPWAMPRNKLRRSGSGNSRRKSAENCPAGYRLLPKCQTYLTLSSPGLKVLQRLTKSRMASPRLPSTTISCRRTRSPLSRLTRLNDWWVPTTYLQYYIYILRFLFQQIILDVRRF